MAFRKPRTHKDWRDALLIVAHNHEPCAPKIRSTCKSLREDSVVTEIATKALNDIRATPSVWLISLRPPFASFVGDWDVDDDRVDRLAAGELAAKALYDKMVEKLPFMATESCDRGLRFLPWRKDRVTDSAGVCRFRFRFLPWLPDSSSDQELPSDWTTLSVRATDALATSSLPKVVWEDEYDYNMSWALPKTSDPTQAAAEFTRELNMIASC